LGSCLRGIRISPTLALGRECAKGVFRKATASGQIYDAWRVGKVLKSSAERKKIIDRQREILSVESAKRKMRDRKVFCMNSTKRYGCEKAGCLEGNVRKWLKKKKHYGTNGTRAQERRAGVRGGGVSGEDSQKQDSLPSRPL